MKKLFMAIAAVMVLLSGCAGQSQLQDSGTNILVRAGVAEFIAGEANAAESIIAFSDDILGLLDGDPTILIEHLREYADEWIPWESLSPGRRILASELLVIVEAHLTAGVTSGELPPDATVRLRELFDIAKRQAQLELRLAQ